MSKSFDKRIFQRMLGSDDTPLPREVARFFLDLNLNTDDHDRIELLSDKANEGVLTSEEHDELATYVVLVDFLGVMQSKARVSLNDKNSAA